MKRVMSATVIAVLTLSGVEAAQTMESRRASHAVVIEWNEIVMRTVTGANGAEQIRIPAIAHLAIFEAVNAVIGGFKGYLEDTAPSPGASADAAAIAAAHTVLVNYFPGQAGQLDAERQRSLDAVPEGPGKERGIALGEDRARALIRHRENDGSSPPGFFVPSTSAPGQWQLTPGCSASGGVLFHVRNLTPFGIRRGDQFRSAPPPALTSRRFARDFAEVRTIGAAETDDRPQDRNDVAHFYALVQSQHVWNPVARQLASERRESLNTAARLFALLNMAMNDALIAVMDTKYHYTFWRPETAIRAADTDGNPKTEPDASFEPFITTPCHPSYPSAHASLSHAASAVVERFYGNRHHDVVLATPALPGVELHYRRLDRITTDIDDARIYGGIHFRFDQQAGARQGREVGEYLVAHHLRPARPRHGDDTRAEGTIDSSN
jgi:PAP2 superfamily